MNKKKFFKSVFLTGFVLLGTHCGPGLVIIPPPAVSITSPADGAQTSILLQTYTGTCEDGLPLTIQYSDSDITGPTSATCDGGAFSFGVALSAINGFHGATVSQIDFNLHTGSASAALDFSRLPLNVAAGFNNSVNAIWVDSSNNAYVGGAFTTFGGTTASHIGRITPAGVLDSTFVIGTGFNGAVNVIAPAPDNTGDIYIGGNFTTYQTTNSESYIARVTTVGGLNATFGNSGFNGAVNAIVGTPDATGDIYVGGAFIQYGSTTNINGIARINTAGVLNMTSTFNIGTGSTAGFSGGGIVNAIAVAPDGSEHIYVGGSFTNYNGNSNLNNIVCLNPDGTVFTSFKVTAPTYTGFNGAVTTILPTTDGSGDIFVGGDFTTFNGSPAGYIVRLTSSGGISNKWTAALSFDAQVNQLIYTDSTDTEIYAAGAFNNYGTNNYQKVAKILIDGAIDTSFDPAAGFDSSSSVTAIALNTDSSGNIYLGGSFVQFNGTGFNRFLLCDSSAAADTSFNAGAGFNDEILAVTPATDGTGDIYVGGKFTYYNGTLVNHFVRLQMNGVLNPTMVTGVGFSDYVAVIMVAPDSTGDVYVGGNFITYNSSNTVNRFARISSTGALIFGSVGTGGFNAAVTSLLAAPEANGDIYVGGGFASYSGQSATGLIRLSSTGTVVSSFTTQHPSGFGDGGGTVLINSLVAAADSSLDIIVGGAFTTYQGINQSGIARLQNDGTIDSSFSNAGLQGGVANTMILASNGDIFVGGTFSGYGTSPNVASNYLIRLTSEGVIATNPAFVVGSGFTGTAVYAISGISASTDLIVGGAFSAFNTLPAPNLVMATAAGQLESTFSVGNGPDNSVLVLTPAVDGSGDTYVGGAFQNYGTTSTDSLFRMTSSGALD